MSVPGRVVLVVIWLASLAGVGVWAQAQSQQQQQQEQRVISGSDLGFRVERIERDGTPIGKLVVRANGKWVETGFSVGVAKAGTK
jgi:hypothetical protein